MVPNYYDVCHKWTIWQRIPLPHLVSVKSERSRKKMKKDTQNYGNTVEMVTKKFEPAVLVWCLAGHFVWSFDRSRIQTYSSTNCVKPSKKLSQCKWKSKSGRLITDWLSVGSLFNRNSSVCAKFLWNQAEKILLCVGNRAVAWFCAN